MKAKLTLSKKWYSHQQRCRTIFSFLLVVSVLSARAQETDVLLGFNFGTSITSNPSSMQKRTGRSHYFDVNGTALLFLIHQQVSDIYSYEVQFPFPLPPLGVYSTVHSLDHTEDETKIKWTFPVDVRWFLGSEKISAFAGLGLQYSTVWDFISTKGDSHTNTYYDPWWGYYYQETYHDKDDFQWKWTANQLSANFAVGTKIGLFSADAQDPRSGNWQSYKPLNVILGAKFHFPIINNGEKHGDGDNYVDLSRDKTCVSLLGGISINWPGGAFKIDYEYPLGANNKYALYDGGHGTFFNTTSQSISATLLFKLH